MICPFCGATQREDKPQFCASCGKSLANLAVAQPAAGLLTPGQEEVYFEGRPAAIGSVGALVLTILTVGLAAIYFWMRTLGKRYRITSQRVVVESGVFGKRMDQIDLYRVVDFAVERSFGQRIMGTGTLVLEAMDKTTPELRIEGIRADVTALYERLRAAAEVEKQRRGVRLMDVERP
jgi:uncharacterized membrane protein YdbT with pleckstrin-like domain